MAFDMGSAVGYLDLDVDGFRNGVQSAWADFKTFMDETATAGDKFQATGKIMTNAGSALTLGVTTPLIGAGTAAVNLGNEFEAQMSRVQATLGLTKDEMGGLHDQALQLGADTAFSASEAADGMENLASAGFNANQIMSAIPGVLDLAAASGASVGDSAAYAAGTLNSFQLEASQASHVADVYAQVAADTNAQTEDLGEAMKYIGPVANSMGMSMEEAAAAVGVLSNANILGSQAGTTLRSALSSMAKPSEEASDLMDQLGLSFYDAEGNMKGFSTIIGEMQTTLSGLTQEQRDNALVTIFGQEALSGLQVLMVAGKDELDQMTYGLENCDGAAQNMATTMQDNTKGAIEQMMGSIESAAIAIQEMLAPVITDIANAISDMVGKFLDADEGTQKMILTIAGIAAAAGPVLLVVGNIVKTIGMLTPVFSTVAGAIGTFMTAMGSIHSVAGLFTVLQYGVTTALGSIGGALSALAGPVGIVIALIAGLAVAWATDFNGIRDSVTEWAGQIQSIISGVMEIAQTIITTVLGVIVGLWNSNFANIQGVVTAAFNTIQTFIGDALAVIQSVIDTVLALIRGDWEGAWSGIKDIFSNVWNMVINLLMNYLNQTLQMIVGIGGGLLQAATGAFEFIAKGFTTVWNNIISWFKEASEQPGGILGTIGDSLMRIGSDIIGGFLSGIKSAWDGVVGFFQDALSWITGIFNDISNKSSQVTRATSGVSARVSGSYASGLDYVPRDMNVRVHQGEAILTKEQNKERINGYNGGQMVIEVPLYIDGKKFARAVAKPMDTELGKLR